ncbi:MAG: fructosamine kinase family protein [Chromatiaceae bacterium]|nr:fructosamine kinase family protein [Chromatiaceae bacterium]
MTELFDGSGTRFRAANEDAWLLSSDDPARKWLRNLRHVLNHLNVFGVYLRRA